MFFSNTIYEWFSYDYVIFWTYLYRHLGLEFFFINYIYILNKTVYQCTVLPSSCRAISINIPAPLSTSPPYRLSLPAAPQGYNPYSHSAAVCWFELVALAILNKSWRQHPTKQQLYSHLPPIMKTFKVRRTKHAGHCWRSRKEFISDVLLWTPSHGRAKAGRPARIYIQQLCVDMECNPEDLPEAMDDREGWRERVRDIHSDGATWWWWFVWRIVS